MRYKTIRIDARRDNYRYSVAEMDGDRVDSPLPGPTPAGWYHFPASMDTRSAFDALKSAMIVSAMQQIEDLAKSIRTLTELKFDQASRRTKAKGKSK